MEEGDENTKLVDYLVWLGKDPKNLQRFLQNPERSMTDFGVSPEARDLVLQGNVEAIHQIVRTEVDADAVAFIVYPHNWPIVHW